MLPDAVGLKKVHAKADLDSPSSLLHRPGTQGDKDKTGETSPFDPASVQQMS
jgi:hypothetical protein